jgi:hypothetical protein
VLKRHAKNIRGVRLDMLFSFLGNRGHQDVEGLKVLDIMLKDAKKYIGDVLRIEVNYFYFF